MRYDAVIVGGGPGGSAAAWHLARKGRRVLVVDRARFPREKVCGDGLTPRAVRCLEQMGVATDGPEWTRQEGLRIRGAGVVLELPWPDLDVWPRYSLVRTRNDFDHLLLEHARAAGAEVREGTEVLGPISDARGVVTGVRIVSDGDREDVEAPVVLACDGVAARLGLAVGVRRLERRPMGVAVRTYFRSPRAKDDFLDSYLELWRGNDLLPGYGWIFPVPDGTVNVGLGLLNSSKHFRNVDYRRLLRDWVSGLPREWELTPENQVGKIRGGSLPMGFNRAPVAKPGIMLVGDAAGAVNPFNGEGIAYALETAETAASVADEAIRTGDPGALRAYPRRLHDAYEGYFILGRAFVRLIGNGAVMRTLTRHGLPRERLMRFAFKVLANLTDPRSGDASDRVIDALVRAAPAVRKVVPVRRSVVRS